MGNLLWYEAIGIVFVGCIIEPMRRFDNRQEVVVMRSLSE